LDVTAKAPMDSAHEARSLNAAVEQPPSLTSQALWLLAAKTVGFVLSFAFPLLLVRRLNQVHFGLYKQTFLLIDLAQSILPLGFGMSAFYFLPRETARRPRVVFNILLYNAAIGMLALATLLLFPRVLVALVGSPQLVGYAPLIGVVMAATIFSAFLEVVATANQDIKSSTIFIVFAQFTKAVFMIAAALWSATLGALLAAALIQNSLQGAVLIRYARRKFSGFWKKLDLAFFAEQLRYAMPLGLAGLIYTLETQVHNLWVSKVFGPAAYAIYAMGCFQIPLIGLLYESVAAVLLSRISHLQHTGQHREILELSLRVASKLAAVYLPLYALLMVVGREFLVFLFTRQYEASWPVFAVNLTLLPLSIFPYDPVLRAYAAHRFFLLRVRLILVFCMIPALWAGTQRFGMMGAIGVVVVVAAVERALIIRKVFSILQVRLADLALMSDLVKIGLVAAAAGGGAALLRSVLLPQRPFFILAACGTLFGIIYLAGAWFTRLVSAEDLRAAREWLSSRRLG